MNISYEYAKSIMVNYCPFSYLHTTCTLKKLEKELERIYQSYKDGDNQIYVDRMIKSHLSNDEDEDEYYDEDEEDDFKFSLFETCKILLGDDIKDVEELNDLYPHDSYFDIIKENTQLLQVLPDIILGYIHLRNKGIYEIDLEDRHTIPEYIIDGQILSIIDRDDIPEWMKNQNGEYKNDKGEVLDISQLDISRISPGEKITIFYKAGKYFKSDMIYIIFVESKEESKDQKYIYGFTFERVDPLKIIKYACNDEKILGGVINLYNQKVFDKLKEVQKNIILSFIEKENLILREVVKECGNDVNDLIPNDIINNILSKMIYPELRDMRKIENDILKNSLNKIEMEYQRMKRLDENFRNDDTYYDRFKKQIANFIAGCIKEIDVIKTQKFKDSKMKRDTLLKISGKIYSFLNTKSGIDFMEKHPKFKDVVENKRQELLQDIRQGEEWFKNILIQNIK